MEWDPGCGVGWCFNLRKEIKISSCSWWLDSICYCIDCIEGPVCLRSMPLEGFLACYDHQILLYLCAKPIIKHNFRIRVFMVGLPIVGNQMIMDCHKNHKRMFGSILHTFLLFGNCHCIFSVFWNDTFTRRKRAFSRRKRAFYFYDFFTKIIHHNKDLYGDGWWWVLLSKSQFDGIRPNLLLAPPGVIIAPQCAKKVVVVL